MEPIDKLSIDHPKCMLITILVGSIIEIFILTSLNLN